MSTAPPCGTWGAWGPGRRWAFCGFSVCTPRTGGPQAHPGAPGRGPGPAFAYQSARLAWRQLPKPQLKGNLITVLGAPGDQLFPTPRRAEMKIKLNGGKHTHTHATTVVTRAAWGTLSLGLRGGAFDKRGAGHPQGGPPEPLQDPHPGLASCQDLHVSQTQCTDVFRLQPVHEGRHCVTMQMGHSCRALACPLCAWPFGSTGFLGRLLAETPRTLPAPHVTR